MLRKEDLIKNPCLPYIDIECKHIGGTFRVQAMRAGTRDVFEQRIGKLSELESGVKTNLRAVFLIHCIVDKEGQLIFGLDDLELLSSQHSADIDMLFDAAQRINGMTDSEAELKKK